MAANKVVVPWRPIVMRCGLRVTLLHRQRPLCAVESLNLALLVGAEHERLFGRGQIQTDPAAIHTTSRCRPKERRNPR